MVITDNYDENKENEIKQYKLPTIIVGVLYTIMLQNE